MSPKIISIIILEKKIKWLAINVAMAFLCLSSCTHVKNTSKHADQNLSQPEQPICSESAALIKGLKLKIAIDYPDTPNLNHNKIIELPYESGETPILPAYLPRALLSMKRNAVTIVEVFPYAPDVFSVAVISYVVRRGKLVYSSTNFVNVAPCEEGEMSIVDAQGRLFSMKVKLELVP